MNKRLKINMGAIAEPAVAEHVGCTALGLVAKRLVLSCGLRAWAGVRSLGSSAFAPQVRLDARQWTGWYGSELQPRTAAL